MTLITLDEFVSLGKAELEAFRTEQEAASRALARRGLAPSAPRWSARFTMEGWRLIFRGKMALELDMVEYVNDEE